MLKLDIPTSYLMRKVPKMGKKRVELKRIQNPSSRHATFYKRKSGLLKKAFKLSVLCDAEVAIIIFSETGKIYEFASHDDVTTILAKYRLHKETTSSSTSSPLENTEVDQLQLKRLNEKMEILQKRERNMVGQDLEPLKMKELQQLEKQLQKGIKRICDKKMQIFTQSCKLLLHKVRSLEEQNTELHSQLTNRGDSSTSAPDLFSGA